MTDLNLPRKINLVFLLVAVVLLLGILASGVPAGHLRNALLSLNWCAWLVFVGTYPYAVLVSGFVTGTQPTSRSHRAASPARFWTGFVATTLFWVAVLAVITLYSYMAWYRAG